MLLSDKDANHLQLQRQLGMIGMVVEGMKKDEDLDCYPHDRLYEFGRP